MSDYRNEYADGKVFVKCPYCGGTAKKEKLPQSGKFSYVHATRTVIDKKEIKLQGISCSEAGRIKDF
jgi:uncharacterized C2H2 Zn-finger protein